MKTEVALTPYISRPMAWSWHLTWQNHKALEPTMVRNEMVADNNSNNNKQTTNKQTKKNLSEIITYTSVMSDFETIYRLRVVMKLTTVVKRTQTQLHLPVHRNVLKRLGQNDVTIHASLTSWCRHQMETLSALLAICAGNSLVPDEFPSQRPETRIFDIFFDLRLNKRLSEQSWGWWFETLSRPLWRHRNVFYRNPLIHRKQQWPTDVSLITGNHRFPCISNHVRASKN